MKRKGIGNTGGGETKKLSQSISLFIYPYIQYVLRIYVRRLCIILKIHALNCLKNPFALRSKEWKLDSCIPRRGGGGFLFCGLSGISPGLRCFGRLSLGTVRRFFGGRARSVTLYTMYAPEKCRKVVSTLYVQQQHCQSIVVQQQHLQQQQQQ